ncbi:MAG: bifunctional serine/threonine-protein kinase/ABC transporter substrate-binding protein [Prochloraceae cyanobacterium]|nr:bifunctional serine/threonine-protein kinase/ABC transporter substrate-binding protein [Prochloraceae cyanobacterium]
MMLNSGETIGENYKIICSLKKGGFSQTYKAKDTTKPDNPLCVVKEMKLPPDANPHFLQDLKNRFKREAETLKVLGSHSRIPQLYNYWEEKDRFYLVQEYIEGHDLRKELLRGKRIPEKKVIELLIDILYVLEFVHQGGFIHRDIKPSNIIRRAKDGRIFLIDFGAVKEIDYLSRSPQREKNKTKIIGTEYYISPESQAGKPKFNSDIYAVGIIGIQALTGLHPKDFPSDPRTGEIIWRFASQEQLIAPVSLELEAIINKMVRYHFKDRYQSVNEVIEALLELNSISAKVRLKKNKIALENLEKKQKKFKISPFQNLLGWGMAFGIGAFSIGLGAAIATQAKTCDLNSIGDRLSCGEEILTEERNTPEKAEAVKAFAQGKYKNAIAWFKRARVQDPSDPETLIYLNNAKLAASNAHTYTIAVAVPLGTREEGGEQGREILRGVAQLQQEINQQNSQQKFGIRIVIANDDNSVQESQRIAAKIAKLPEILTVIGHYNSANTRAALPIYQQENIVLISPSDIVSKSDRSQDFFFSIYPQTTFYSEALTQYTLNRSENNKVAVFYNPDNPYSNAIYESFFQLFYRESGQVEKQFDISQPDFNSHNAIEKVGNTKASTILFFADDRQYGLSFDNILRIIQNNQNQYSMLATAGLYGQDILKEGKLVENLVIATPWHYLDSPDLEFVTRAKSLWQKSDLSWRTAMGYDAALTSIAAFKDLPALNFLEWMQVELNPKIRRNQLQQSLAKPDFTAPGATGTISFLPNGDRAEALVTFVKVAADSCSPHGYSFILVGSNPPELCDRGEEITE